MVGMSIQEDVCTAVTCTKTIGDMLIKYSGFVRVADKAFNRTASKVVQVTGTVEERERNCVEECVNEGIDSCTSSHIEKYSSVRSSSECSLFGEDAYMDYPDEKAYMRLDQPGYVSFHLKVNRGGYRIGAKYFTEGC